MTRGKHGQAAHVKREAAEQAAEVGTYQRKVAELTRQVKDAQTELHEVHERYKREMAGLRAQVREAIGPAVSVAQNEAKKMRAERDAAHAQIVVMQKRWEKMLYSVERHGREEHGMGGSWMAGDTGANPGGGLSGMVRINEEWVEWMRKVVGLDDFNDDSPPVKKIPNGMKDVRRVVNRNAEVES